MVDETLADRIRSIDGGRFTQLVDALDIHSTCERCYHFNPLITDPEKAYRCKVTPLCIAATIHPKVQSYIWMKLGWTTEKDDHGG